MANEAFLLLSDVLWRQREHVLPCVGTELGEEVRMNRDDSRLLRHLGLAVAVKLAVIAALWWVFVRDRTVDASSEQTAAHLMAPANAPVQHPSQPTPIPTNRQEPGP